MKRLSLFLILFAFSIMTVSAASVETNVSRVQTASSYTAPSGYEDKGFIGSIIADIFDITGRIQNQYISAFQMIQGILINNIPRWDGQKFVEGTITDNGTNVGIGTNVLTERLNVNGRITTNFAPNSTNDVGNVAYNDGRYINVGETIKPTLGGYVARSFNTTYTSSYGGTIVVRDDAGGSADCTFIILIDGTELSRLKAKGWVDAGGSFLVPTGATYRVNMSGGGCGTSWLRYASF